MRPRRRAPRPIERPHRATNSGALRTPRASECSIENIGESPHHAAASGGRSEYGGLRITRSAHGRGGRLIERVDRPLQVGAGEVCVAERHLHGRVPEQILDRLQRHAALRPRLLVLDPLVRLHRLDENSASDISRLLGFLTELQRALDLAIVLVHHASKKHRAQPGQALRGSSDLHAWGASNAYLARGDEHLVLTLEHRAARPLEPMLIELVSRPDGSATHLALRAGGESATPLAPTQQILDVLRAANGPMLRKALRARLRINNHRLGEALDLLEKRRLVQRTPAGWLPITPPDQPTLFD